jgi:uncharacterized protein (DUF362 family)
MINKKITKRDFLKILAATSVGIAAGRLSNYIEIPKILKIRQSNERAVVNFQESNKSYSDQTKEDVKKAIERVNYLHKVLDSNSSVVLKPNLMEADKNDAITTNALVIEGVIEYLEEQGIKNNKMFIAEGPCCAFDIHDVLKKNKISALLKKHGMQFIYIGFAETQKVEVPNPIVRKSLYIPKILMQEDTVLINMPKLKVHNIAGLTCCMKNLMGVMPISIYASVEGSFQRTALHRMSNDRDVPMPLCEVVHGSIADINSVVKTHFCVVDGIVFMDKYGPDKGVPTKLGFIITGNDMLAVDATIARRAGLDPNKIAHIKLAALKNLGKFEEEEIDVIGSKRTFTIKFPGKNDEEYVKQTRNNLGDIKEVTDNYPYPEFNSIEEWRKIARAEKYLK